MAFLEKILQEKRREVSKLSNDEIISEKPIYSFIETVKQEPAKMHVIAEIKRASPSKGTIRKTVDPLEQAKCYQEAGVAAISVLTDETFFNGSIEDLRIVAQHVELPVLCKDFIINEKQIIRAKNAGASLVLLIVAALSIKKLEELHRMATKLGLEVLVETHTIEEMEIAKKIGATLIGVNNRDLKTFQTDLNQSIHLAQPKDDRVYISESGIQTTEDVKKLAPYYQGVLVGETLMKAQEPQKIIKEWRQIDVS